MTTDARPLLAGPVVDVRPLALHFHEVFIEGLEEDVPISGDDKVRATVFFDGHHADLHLQAQVGVFRDHDVLLVVRVAAPTPPGAKSSRCI